MYLNNRDMNGVNFALGLTLTLDVFKYANNNKWWSAKSD